jgi:hypothetical protein
MPSLSLTSIARDTLSTCRVRWTDATGASIAEAAGIESATPGLFGFSATYATSVTYPLYWEVRTVTAQTTAGFNAGTGAEGPFLADGGPVASGNTAGEAQTINPGGTVTIVRRSRNTAGQLVDLDAAPTYTLVLNGTLLASTSTSDAYIAIAHTNGSGIYGAFATVTGSLAGQSGYLQISGTLNGVAVTDSVQFTVVSVSATVSPVVAQASGVLYVTRDLPRIPAGSAPAFAWTVTDATGAAVNLSGKTVRFVVASIATNVDPFAETETALFKYETGGSGVVVSGTSSNVATVQVSATDTAAHVGSLRYWLLNATDKQILASGKLPIVPAALDYP